MDTKLISAAILSMSLAACGGGGSGGSGSGSGGLPGAGQDSDKSLASPDTVINSFVVTGYEAADDAVQKISAYENGGSFRLDWQASASTDPYRVEFYTSSDPLLSDDDDDFAAYNCGSLSFYACDSSGSQTCTFDTDNRVICGEKSAFNSGDNLTDLLDTLPKDLYILIEVCNGFFDECKVKSVQVRFE